MAKTDLHEEVLVPTGAGPLTTCPALVMAHPSADLTSSSSDDGFHENHSPCRSPDPTGTTAAAPPQPQQQQPSTATSAKLPLMGLVKVPSFEGSSSSSSGSGIQSRGSSTETYTDSTGTDLEQFFIQTLNRDPKDRDFLLRVEKVASTYVNSPSTEYYRFEPMQPYQRMLVHRVAAFFGLEHNVDNNNSVVVNKTLLTRIPDFKFEENLKKEFNQPETRKSILKRSSYESASLKSSSFQEMAAEKPLLVENRKSKSFEEREVEYEKTRARIFNEDGSAVTSSTFKVLQKSTSVGDKSPVLLGSELGDGKREEPGGTVPEKLEEVVVKVPTPSEPPAPYVISPSPPRTEPAPQVSAGVQPPPPLWAPAPLEYYPWPPEALSAGYLPTYNPKQPPPLLHFPPSPHQQPPLVLMPPQPAVVCAPTLSAEVWPQQQQHYHSELEQQMAGMCLTNLNPNATSFIPRAPNPQQTASRLYPGQSAATAPGLMVPSPRPTYVGPPLYQYPSRSIALLTPPPSLMTLPQAAHFHKAAAMQYVSTPPGTIWIDAAFGQQRSSRNKGNRSRSRNKNKSGGGGNKQPQSSTAVFQQPTRNNHKAGSCAYVVENLPAGTLRSSQVEQYLQPLLREGDRVHVVGAQQQASDFVLTPGQHHLVVTFPSAERAREALSLHCPPNLRLRPC